MTAWKASDLPDQTGRTSIVTGANSGLGRVVTESLAKAGAEVVLAVRNTRSGEEAARAITNEVPNARLHVEELDLASLASVRAFSARIVQRHPRIDVLINNAGLVVLGPRRTTSDGFELHLGTNFLGHFALTGLLLPSITEGKQPRIVSLSSITHKTAHLDFDDLMSERGYDAAQAYGESKLATTTFGLELDRRLRASRSPVISVIAHPGVSRSNLTPRAYEHRGRAGRMIARVLLLATQSTGRGALPELYAATAPDVHGGQFFGPAGRREVMGRVTEVHASAEAADLQVGQKLWEAGEHLTRVTYL